MADATLSDTYVSALQYDFVVMPPETTLVGVVRNPTAWFHGTVDENVPELGPPADLLERFNRTKADLKMQGLCAAGAHNAAWDQLGFADTYRTHLETAADAQAALETLEARLRSGESIALVCYENTAKKRCHRTLLRDRLESRLESA